ncbi:MAG: DUF2271 domain-containing protein [Spongiibacteraceae bacterium]
MRALSVFLCGVFVCGAVQGSAQQPLLIQTHQQGVLGTSLDISLYVNPVDAQISRESVASAVSYIAELENILSTYRAGSEISRLNSAVELTQPSANLLAVLDHCNHWFKQSAGFFSCSLGKLKTLWQQADESQVVPDRVAIRNLARQIHRVAAIDVGQRPLRLEDNIQIDADGLAKGYIIDQIFKYLRNHLPDAVAIKVDIGGDGRYWRADKVRQPEWQVTIANPNQLADNGKGLATVALNDRAIAASGHNSRYFEIDYRRFSHIITPQDGWPMFDAPAAFVIAKDATTADAVATALSAQEMTAGIDWVNQLEDVEALLISPQGLQLSSKNWSSYSRGSNASSTVSFKLNIDYSIPNINTSEYNKPYVAIWITDTSGKPVRNLLLLGENERWAHENTRWWRKIGRRNANLLMGISRPTRQPGNYNLSWDGSDDFGEYLAAGTYTLHVEAAREQGGHEYKKVVLHLLQQPFEQTLEASGEELGVVTLHYTPVYK